MQSIYIIESLTLPLQQNKGQSFELSMSVSCVKDGILLELIQLRIASKLNPAPSAQTLLASSV